MAKWARIADGKLKALLQFPPISRLGEETLYYSNKEKATILIEQFFLLPIEADLSNILGFIYLEPRNIKKEIEKEDIIMALKGLTPNKALGLKKIINYFIKLCGEQLAVRESLAQSVPRLGRQHVYKLLLPYPPLPFFVVNLVFTLLNRP